MTHEDMGLLIGGLAFALVAVAGGCWADGWAGRREGSRARARMAGRNARPHISRSPDLGRLCGLSPESLSAWEWN